MKIEYTKETPRKIRDYNQEEIVLNSEEVEDIAEIFKTPITGTILYKTIGLLNCTS